MMIAEYYGKMQGLMPGIEKIDVLDWAIWLTVIAGPSSTGPAMTTGRCSSSGVNHSAVWHYLLKPTHSTVRWAMQIRRDLYNAAPNRATKAMGSVAAR